MTDDGVLRIATLCGSLRRGSFNRALLAAAVEAAPAGVEFVEVAIRTLPPYDEDLERGDGDDTERAMRAALADADGLLVATPEYNHGMPGLLKNALDWASRPLLDGPLMMTPAAVMGIGSGRGAPERSVEAARETLVLCGAQLLDPPPLLLASGRDTVVVAESGDPELRNDEARDAMAGFMERFVEHVRAGRDQR